MNQLLLNINLHKEDVKNKTMQLKKLDQHVNIRQQRKLVIKRNTCLRTKSRRTNIIINIITSIHNSHYFCLPYSKKYEIPNTMISLTPTASNISRCILMFREIYSATSARAQWSLRYEVQVKKQQEEH